MLVQEFVQIHFEIDLHAPAVVTIGPEQTDGLQADAVQVAQNGFGAVVEPEFLEQRQQDLEGLGVGGDLGIIVVELSLHQHRQTGFVNGHVVGGKVVAGQDDRLFEPGQGIVEVGKGTGIVHALFDSAVDKEFQIGVGSDPLPEVVHVGKKIAGKHRIGDGFRRKWKVIRLNCRTIFASIDSPVDHHFKIFSEYGAFLFEKIIAGINVLSQQKSNTILNRY